MISFPEAPKKKVFTEELFEKYQLYRKMYRKMEIGELPISLDRIEVVNINMYCNKCKDTFNPILDWYSPFQENMSTKYSTV